MDNNKFVLNNESNASPTSIPFAERIEFGDRIKNQRYFGVSNNDIDKVKKAYEKATSKTRFFFYTVLPDILFGIATALVGSIISAAVSSVPFSLKGGILFYSIFSSLAVAFFAAFIILRICGRGSNNNFAEVVKEHVLETTEQKEDELNI